MFFKKYFSIASPVSKYAKRALFSLLCYRHPLNFTILEKWVFNPLDNILLETGSTCCIVRALVEYTGAVEGFCEKDEQQNIMGGWR